MHDCVEPIVEEGPGPDDKWTLMFDGAVNVNGNGVGVVLINPKGDIFGPVSKVYLPATEGVEASIWLLAKAYVVV